MRTADIKFLELCDEIDYWKNQAKKAEEEAQYWKDQYSQHLKDSLETSQKGIANALMLALHVKDDKNGNLVISKEDRKKLAQQMKD